MVIAVFAGLSAVCSVFDYWFIKYYFIKTRDPASLSGIMFVRKRKEKGIMIITLACSVLFTVLGIGASVLQYFFRPGTDVFLAGERLLILRLVSLCAVTDLSDRVIPNALTIGGAVMRAVSICVGLVSGAGEYDLVDIGLGWLTVTVALLGIRLFSKKGLGGGDVKLMSCLSLCFGLRGIFPLLFVSFILSALYGILMLAVKKAKMKDSFPLAPFLLAGTLFECAAELF
ncbi:MAG: prepilin peptidase [Clostridia bacterium]|nr:prepilin peptidase [Clostridia bacterium]